MAKLPNHLIGAAGEYHVAAQLSMRRWLATVTIKNAPGTDVLARHLDTGRLIAVQCKTTNARGTLLLSKGDERPDATDSEWYVLVIMAGVDERPTFYVVPRNHMSALLWVNHRRWVAGTKASGEPRKDTTMREVPIPWIASYQEDWGALLAPPSAAPYRLPPWFLTALPAFGLPEGHPDAGRLLAGT